MNVAFFYQLAVYGKAAFYVSSFGLVVQRFAYRLYGIPGYGKLWQVYTCAQCFK